MWRKSSYSISVNCVQADPGDGKHRLVRDSKLGDDSPVLRYPAETWNKGFAMRFYSVPKEMVPGRVRALKPESIAWFAVWDGLGAIAFFDDAERLAFEHGRADGEFAFEPALA